MVDRPEGVVEGELEGGAEGRSLGYRLGFVLGAAVGAADGMDVVGGIVGAGLQSLQVKRHTLRQEAVSQSSLFLAKTQ